MSDSSRAPLHRRAELSHPLQNSQRLKSALAIILPSYTVKEAQGIIITGQRGEEIGFLAFFFFFLVIG